MSAEHEHVFHRSLDVLHFWITDCRRVDFTPQPSLVSALEAFLNTEVTPRADAPAWLRDWAAAGGCGISGGKCCVFLQVIPVDGRGEALLAALHAPACSPRSQQRDSLVTFEEDDSPSSLHSSAEDLGKKVLANANTEDKVFSFKPNSSDLVADLYHVCVFLHLFSGYFQE